MTIESTGEFFEEMWHGSVEKKISFFPFFIPFNRYPGRTDEWLEEEMRTMPASKRALAKQEHPRTPEEAFQIAGGRYFSVKDLEAHHKRLLQDPKRIGFLIENSDGSIEFRDDPNGLVAIYHEPEPGEEYVEGGDPAEGVEQDNTVLAVVRKRDFALCARFLDNTTQPDEAARVGIKLAKYYNQCIIAAENNNTHGGMMNLELKNGYWNVYYYEIVDRDNAKPVKRWGWSTNGQNRTWIVDHLDKLIRNHSTSLNDKILYEELKEWVIDPKSGRGDHKKGRHDDFIIAFAIACWVIRENPWFDRKKAQQAQSQRKDKNKRPTGGY